MLTETDAGLATEARPQMTFGDGKLCGQGLQSKRFVQDRPAFLIDAQEKRAAGLPFRNGLAGLSPGLHGSAKHPPEDKAQPVREFHFTCRGFVPGAQELGKERSIEFAEAPKRFDLKGSQAGPLPQFEGDELPEKGVPIKAGGKMKLKRKNQQHLAGREGKAPVVNMDLSAPFPRDHQDVAMMVIPGQWLGCDLLPGLPGETENLLGPQIDAAPRLGEVVDWSAQAPELAKDFG